MSPSESPRSVVVAVFQREAEARDVADAVRALGVPHESVGVLLPGQSLSPSSSGGGTDLLSLAAGASDGHELSTVLSEIGVPEGEARFYADEAGHGRSLVVVRANGRADEVRKFVLEHGGSDVQSRGAELIRSGEHGVPGGVGARPVDVTGNWDDFRSRYQMLWQQHYGTTDATWEQMEPLYQYGWQLANQPAYRGMPWSSVADTIRQQWQSSSFGKTMDWSDADGPLHDVWEDVAEEAATGAEGGADRRIPTSGTDQSVAARDLQPPTEGAA
jgi:hypothetical protein